MGADHELADRLARQLFRLIRTLERAKTQAAALRGDQLERACFGLLVELGDRGPLRMTVLADAVLADPSTVSRQVAQLVDLGYVERLPDPDDGRASRLAATKRGLEHLAAGRRRRNQLLDRVLAGWSASDREQFVRLLERLNDGFDHNRPQPLRAEPVRAGRGHA